MGKDGPCLILNPSGLDLPLGFFVWSSGQVHRGAEMQALVGEECREMSQPPRVQCSSKDPCAASRTFHHGAFCLGRHSHQNTAVVFLVTSFLTPF